MSCSDCRTSKELHCRYRQAVRDAVEGSVVWGGSEASVGEGKSPSQVVAPCSWVVSTEEKALGTVRGGAACCSRSTGKEKYGTSCRNATEKRAPEKVVVFFFSPFFSSSIPPPKEAPAAAPERAHDDRMPFRCSASSRCSARAKFL